MQVYVGQKSPSEERPVKELKAFKKVFLKKGERKNVTLEIPVAAFAFYHDALPGWTVEADKYRIAVASSSRDIRRTTEVEVTK